ncbi:unnamed protein product [Cylindrotheca closterium]|uniref:Dephospho-CoA kinase n=1 Tax=Cylindrotheca closterium TaxID=2856 RepID=A0AAD2PX14_9STRA|nr:unnamed protein product [Cylindrotheca closterium]
MVVFLVGKLLIQWLLASLSCVPLSEKGKGDYYYGFSWLLQSYGMFCPSDFESIGTLLSPDAMAILFSLRLVFVCLGVHLGESMCFVALTGGIACGKSSVSGILVGSQSSDNYQDGTVGLICADTIAHQILLPPSVLESYSVEGSNPTTVIACVVKPKESVFFELVAAFEGHDILSPNGTIDRTKMGSIVFRDGEKRRGLNRITHPKIFSILMSRLVHQALFSNNDLVVADVPLLFESGKLSWLFAITICVVTDPVTQFHRLQLRNPELSPKECEDRINSQLNLDLKMKLSDIVIDNSGSLDELKDKVEDVRRDIMRRLFGIGLSLLQVLLLIGGSTSIAISSKFFSQT